MPLLSSLNLSVSWAAVAALSVFVGCATTDRDALIYPDADRVEVVSAVVETAPVASSNDAADDPAIWINQKSVSESRIFGTDKQSGIAVYDLSGRLLEFIPAGRPNNIDIRQNLTSPAGRVDVAGFSERETDGVGWLSIGDEGTTKLVSILPTDSPEPYGFCLGVTAGELVAYVTYKNGLIEQYQVDLADEFAMSLSDSYQFDSQLEGCVQDDQSQVVFVGEEGRGLWRLPLQQGRFAEPELIDEVDGASGIAADVEGVALYKGDPQVILVSSQGNDSYAMYDLAYPHSFIKRFRIVTGETGIDGAQETDGLDATSAFLGDRFPNGLVVVQDGFNEDPSGRQNFKIIAPPISQ